MSDITVCAVLQSSPVIIEDQRMNAGGPTSVVAQTYVHQMNRDNVSAYRHEVLRRSAVSESHGQHPNVQGLSGVPRGPLVGNYAGADQPARPADHLRFIRCETCSRPAKFVCSGCVKAAYCSEECQVCFVLSFIIAVFAVLLFNNLFAPCCSC